MVDSTLPPEDPQATAVAELPESEAASQAATGSSGSREGEAPVGAAAPSAAPEPNAASETQPPGTVVASSLGDVAPGESAVATEPGSATTSTPISGDRSPADGNPTVAAVSSASSAPVSPAPAAPEPPAARPPEGVSSTISVPPLDEQASGDGEGGEFDLLISRVSAWLKRQDLPSRWEKLQGPLRGLALLVVVLVVLRLYGALIDTLDSLPLVPRLFQLVGVIVLVKFSLTNLVRTSDRERLISSWQQRWSTFRGRV